MFSIIMQCQKNVWIANWALVRAKRKRLKVSISKGFSFKGLDWYVPSQFESINQLIGRAPLSLNKSYVGLISLIFTKHHPK
jgi:hypothetical protein